MWPKTKQLGSGAPRAFYAPVQCAAADVLLVRQTEPLNPLGRETLIRPNQAGLSAVIEKSNYLEAQ